MRRTFSEVGGSAVRMFGEEEMETEVVSPFDGAVLVFEVEEGEVVAEVEEGDAEEEAAASLGLRLRWDGLLPDGAVEEESTWELDGDAFLVAIGLADHAVLFPAPEREEPEEGRGRGRGRGGRGGQAPAALFRDMEWTVELSVSAADDEGFAVIAIEAHGEGEPPQREGAEGGGGGRGGPMELSGSHEADLEGELRFSLADRLPTALNLEGSVTLATERTSSGGEREMSIVQVQEGEFALVAEAKLVSEEE